MVTRKELSDFAAFCYNKYNLEIQPGIIKEYIDMTNPFKQIDKELHDINSHFKVKECNSNNVSCSHISFDSVRCKDCEYSIPSHV